MEDDDPFERAARREQSEVQRQALKNSIRRRVDESIISSTQWSWGWTGKKMSRGVGIALRVLIPPTAIWAFLFWIHYQSAASKDALGGGVFITHAIFFGLWALVVLKVLWAWFITRGVERMAKG